MLTSLRLKFNVILELVTIVGHSVGVHIGGIISDMFKKTRLTFIQKSRVHMKTCMKNLACAFSLVNYKIGIPNVNIGVDRSILDRGKSPFIHNVRYGFEEELVDYGLIGILVGGDPAGPSYRDNMPLEPVYRVRAGLAIYSMIIHSNATLYGLEFLVGDSDFFPYGGISQPCCKQSARNYIEKPMKYLSKEYHKFQQKYVIYSRICLIFFSPRTMRT